MKKIAIAADHAGFELKEYLKSQLNNYDFNDFGTYSNESMDYPDIAHPLALAIENGESDFGIIICGSGNGVNMVVNKYPHVRSALCWQEDLAILARKHNNANVLALPARFIEKENALMIVKSFFSADFEGGRHQRRVEKICPNKI